MKAVAVRPGVKNSVHLVDAPLPKVGDIADGRGVLVKVLKVGVDATDREINEALYGNAPPGCDYLIIGHEVFGKVQEVGPNVKRVRPGDYCTLTVRRPGGSIYDPQSGKTYDSKLSLNPDGTLKVEGCISIICQAQTWKPAP